MIALVDHILDEISYAGVKRKQRSITRLFPPFYRRVQAVADKGGVRLRDVEPDLWKFRVHSGTQDSIWYDIVVKFKDLLDVLQTGVMDRRMWVKAKDHVNLRKLAKHVLYHVNIQLLCSCPAFQYWGPAYIMSLSRYDGKYTDPETRPPRIRNPRQYGAICKHLEAVMKVLPFYESSMAKYLKQFYADEIAEYEDAAKEQFGWVKRAAVALGRRRERPEEEEEEEEETEESIKKAKIGLFHITAKNLGDVVILKPRIPFAPAVGEDRITPRVSLSWSISGAIKGITQLHIDKNKVYYVYKVINKPELYEPDDTEVPDVMVTNEIWAVSSVKLRKIEEIKIDWPRNRDEPKILRVRRKKLGKEEEEETEEEF